MTDSEPAREVRLDRAGEAEERRLIEAAQQDRARFVEIYEKYFELVYAYAARRTLNRDEAEDLTAEVFRKALENLPRFKWTGAPFGAWLLRISFNLIADRSKRLTREGDSSSRVSKGTDTAREASSAAQTQQSAVEDAERSARLFRFVNDLADDQRRVIMMRFAEEKSIHDIAGELGRSEGAVKQLQFRALQNLRAKLVSHTK